MISFYPRKLDGWIRRHVRFSGSRTYPTVTHSIQSCLAHNPLPYSELDSDGQVLQDPTGMTWRPNFLLTWQPGTSISATVPWLKGVEDWNMLKICSPVIIYSYGYSWMWMEDDEPHDCSFQSLSLRQGVTWNRYIWGKDGPCSTWPSLDSLQTGTVQQPFRGWIQVFSPNHPPKKVLAAGYQW